MSDDEIPLSERLVKSPQEPTAPSETHSTRTSWGLTEVGIGVVASILIGVICVVIFKSVASDPDRITLPALLAGLSGGWIAYFGTSYLVAKNQPGGMKQQLGFHFDLRNDIPKGILLGVVGQILMAVVYLPLRVIDSGLADDLDGPAKELSAAMSDWRWFVFGFFVVVLSPICEELFFRGVTLRAIASRWGSAMGIVFSGLIFGLIHFQQLQTIGLVAFGMLLAYRATKTKRIGETIFGHATFNLITVLALVTGVS